MGRTLKRGVILVASLCLWGCHTTPPAVTPSPISTVSAIPPPVSSPRDFFRELSLAHQAPAQGPVGLKLVESILENPKLEELDLAKAADLKTFDETILPALRQSFQCSTFLPPQPLRAGQPYINYRGIRRLVQLTSERSQLLWSDGQHEQALALIKLPLSLCKALRARPESVSGSLFCSAYATSALRTVESWAKTGDLQGESLAQLRDFISRQRPDYAHLEQTFAVDIAQLLNSLDDAKSREALGLVSATEAQQKLWKEELLSLHEIGAKLYRWPGAPDSQGFNQAILASSAELQGLIIDYPQVVTMQKHAYLRYLSSEVLLALVAARQENGRYPEKLSLTLSELRDQKAQDYFQSLTDYQPGPQGQAFRIVLKDKTFELLREQPKVLLEL